MSKAAVAIVSGSERLRSALSALRHRNYRLYWFGQLSSVLAQNMEGVAQSWLVLELTDSPLLLRSHRFEFRSADDSSDSVRRRHCRPRRSPPHHDFVPEHLCIDVFSARHTNRPRMGGALACHGLGFPFGLRARLRSAQPHGALAADGAERRYSQRRRHRRHNLAS